jgi:hypothetical protein
MFARLLFVLGIALSLGAAALVELKSPGPGHWSYPHESAQRFAPPLHGSGSPVVLVESPRVAVATTERRESDRASGVLFAGSLALLPVTFWQWLSDRQSFVDVVSHFLGRGG